MNTFFELAKARYSVKGFDGKPVEPEKLQQILDAGNVAPTAKNNQPQRIYVIQSEDALAKARALTPCTYKASTVLLFTYNKDEVFLYPGAEMVSSGAEDVSIVATHIMLEAADLGVGSCWVNFFEPAKAKELFNLPDNEVPVLLMPLGYPAEGIAPLENHMKKKALDQTVKYL
ncbi:MAG: nitroreductase family protein [Stomatobaculum sp.]|nr:nitroreductase family protein [Stomatobaculum sp.]